MYMETYFHIIKHNEFLFLILQKIKYSKLRVVKFKITICFYIKNKMRGKQHTADIQFSFSCFFHFSLIIFTTISLNSETRVNNKKFQKSNFESSHGEKNNINRARTPL